MLFLASASPAAAQEGNQEEASPAIGLALGFGHQPDQWVTGPRFELRGVGAPFVEVEATVLGGVAAEHVTLRAAVHGRLVVRSDGWRVYPLIGGALYAYEPRGRFAEWCDKLQLDCGGLGGGLELGLGGGFRGLALEAYLATGELPLLTLLGSASVVF